ncbi:MAG: hypothetical protein IKR78_03900 [Dehalococcoidales bacterium]|nr:hypothetical protein [Dehalococcoidales bacterium]
MADGYDFTEDDEEINAQREDAKRAEQWENLNEKVMAGALNSLNSRVSACSLQLSRMINENDYVKTKDMLDALMMKDLSSEGWLFTFYNTNKEAFLDYTPGKSHPSWYDGLSADMKKTYDVGLQYYSDVKKLVIIGSSIFMVLRTLRLADGFKLIRVKDNFESAGFDVSLYKRIDNDVQRISNLLNRDWIELENYTQKSRKYIDDNLSKLPKSELEKGYRAERLAEYSTLFKNSGLAESFVATDSEHFSPRPDILVKAAVIDEYTTKISQTLEIKDPMQKTINECRQISTEEIVDAEKKCTTQAAQFLCSAFDLLLKAISDFAEMALETYVNFQEAKDEAPYCFMKQLKSMSVVKPKYSFNPSTSDPWENGTYYEDLYIGAAQALGSQARLFAYDHGTIIA